MYTVINTNFKTERWEKQNKTLFFEGKPVGETSFNWLANLHVLGLLKGFLLCNIQVHVDHFLILNSF